MKKLLLITILGALAAFCLTAEGGVEFSGDMKTLWGVGAPWTDNDINAGRFTLGNTAFTGKFDAWYNNSSAYAEVSFSYDATSSVENAFDISLGELWLDYTDSFWGIRLGRQKAVWGKADGIDITNILCPANMSSLAAMTGDDSKLAVDAIRLSLSGNQFTADAYWIPFFTPAVLPLSIVSIQKPEIAVWNGEYGLKLSGYFSLMDVSLYGYYGWDDNPIMEYSFQTDNSSGLPGSLIINGTYKRMAMLGVDAAVPIGETVLRLEGAFFPQRHFQKTNGGSEQHNQISALAGLDWMPTGWTITAQYYCEYVMDSLEALDRNEAYTHGATLSVSKALLNETLELNFSGLIGFNDFDSLLNPSIQYSLSDQINLGVKAFIFIPGPERTGKYGAYKDLSSFCINAKFSF